MISERKGKRLLRIRKAYLNGFGFNNKGVYAIIITDDNREEYFYTHDLTHFGIKGQDYDVMVKGGTRRW